MFHSPTALVIAVSLACCASVRVGLAEGAEPPADTTATIVGEWETIDRHLAMGSLYQPVHGVRKREGVVRFQLQGDQLTGMAIHEGHAAITHQERWKDGCTELRAVSFEANKLCFEFSIDEWYKHAGPLAVEDARLPNSGTVRVEAELIGERFVGKWRMFLSDGSEAFRGEWEAVPARAMSSAPAGAAQPIEVKLPGQLMIIGGRHQDLTNPLRKLFFALAGGEKARIVIIPTAIAAAEDPAVSDELLQMWRELKPLSVELLHTRNRQTANDPAFVKPLTQATAVFFTNGHRDRILNAYRGTLVEEELKHLHARGSLIGGTGTGAAVLGDWLIHRRDGPEVTEPGLGLLSGFLVDDRDDVVRFSDAVAAHPTAVGLLIDPGTAVVVRDQTLRVFGEATATVQRIVGQSTRRDVLTGSGRLDVSRKQETAKNHE